MIVEAVWGLLPVALFTLGLGLLWYASWRQQAGNVASPVAGSPIWAPAAGYISVILAGVAVAMSTFGFAPLICIVGAVVILAGVSRYRQSEVRYLVWSLAVAAQREIPLEKAARAFAIERGGRLASKARRLAEYLDAAMPLSLAMARSRLHVSPHIQLAADMGEKKGSLGTSLQDAIRQSGTFDATLSRLMARFLYLSCLVLAMGVMLTFMMLKIVPTFQKMYAEYGFALPRMTRWIMEASEFVCNYWFLLAPFALALGFAVVIALLLFVGVPSQSLPLVPHFLKSVENSMVLSSLSIAVRRRQPVLDSLALLSGLAPSARLRRRLGAAVRRVEDGTSWSDALQDSGFISKAQNGVLQSAERAGNLVWALDEIANSILRRAAVCLQALLDVLFPVCLVGIGCCVLCIAAAMLLPLFSLIGKLA
ncbi:MAG: type II secretion system F family protein [Planctomycetota bacterium]